MRLIKLMMLILLLLHITASGQTVRKLNDSIVLVDRYEFKKIILTIADRNAFKSLYNFEKDKCEIQSRIISDKDELIKNQDVTRQLLQKEIEAIKPEWWNKFTYGSAMGALAVLLLIILLK